MRYMRLACACATGAGRSVARVPLQRRARDLQHLALLVAELLVRVRLVTQQHRADVARRKPIGAGRCVRGGPAVACGLAAGFGELRACAMNDLARLGRARSLIVTVAGRTHYQSSARLVFGGFLLQRRRCRVRVSPCWTCAFNGTRTASPQLASPTPPAAGALALRARRAAAGPASQATPPAWSGPAATAKRSSGLRQRFLSVRADSAAPVPRWACSSATRRLPACSWRDVSSVATARLQRRRLSSWRRLPAAAPASAPSDCSRSFKVSRQAIASRGWRCRATARTARHPGSRTWPSDGRAVRRRARAGATLRRITPCSGTSKPLTRALRVYSPMLKNSATATALAATSTVSTVRDTGPDELDAAQPALTLGLRRPQGGRGWT